MSIRVKNRAERPRIESIHVKNYRALKDLKLNDITPLTVFVGPNGSGKSTLFDVFAFLSECFLDGLRRAWERRMRFKELRTRGESGPIVIEVKYREPDYSPITYHLAVEETSRGPVVAEEWMQWSRMGRGKPFRFLDFKHGEGFAASGEKPDEHDERISDTLTSPEVLAVNTLGQFARHPRVTALRTFITGWYLSYLTTTSARGAPETGPQERLSPSGDNLANVVQFLSEQHNDVMRRIETTLARRVPRLEKIEAKTLDDGRLLLQIKDVPFKQPILAKYASDGTLKMLAYLTVLHDPNPPSLVGIEEPENFLHPRLLPELAEECRLATNRSQLMVTTHSPYFVNGLRAKEVWVLYRDENGYTRASRTADMNGIEEFLAHGAHLGQLWTEGHFEVGDPLTGAGGPRIPLQRRQASVGE
jgi:predicted ATPase